MATNSEKVKLLIADTTVPYHFSDAEILVFLDMANDSILLASSYALEAWASSYSASLDSEKIGDYSYSQKIVDKMLNLAKKYREEDASTPVFEWAEPDLTGEDEEDD